MPGRAAQVIALVGSTIHLRIELAQALADGLTARGWRVSCLVDDPGAAFWYPPMSATATASDIERVSIMVEHRHRIEAAAQGHDVLIVAQPLLMLAMACQNNPQAGRSIDMAWGWQHGDLPESSHILISDDSSPEAIERETSLRHALQSARCAYSVASGTDREAQIDQALTSIEHVLDAPQRRARAASSPRWRWLCEKCDDGDCEHATRG